MVNFNFSYAPGTSLQQMVGFETAGRVWSSYLTDNVTVNLYVGVSSSLPTNVIGGALPGISSQTFVDLKDQMQADVTSVDDWVAINGITGRADKQDFKARFDLFDSKGKNSGLTTATRSFNTTRANAKSLGLYFSDGGTALDGVVVFGSLAGSAYTWNYDYARTSAAPANTLDFLSTAIHEIGHILGMTSGVDKPGWLNSSYTDKKAQDEYKKFVANSATYTTPLDLFRYSPSTLGTNYNDLSYGSKGGGKYFSIDGYNVVAQFSTGKDTGLGGSGEQASHWKQGTVAVMAPSLSPGARQSITSIDLRAMDVIGWDLAANAPNLSLNLSALAGQAQQGLAQRLGQTVTWLNANASTAAQSLSSDRSQDVTTMIENSQVYNWGPKPPISPPPSPLTQVIDLMQAQMVYTSFETLDDSEATAGATSVAAASASLSPAAKVKMAGSASQQFAYPLQNLALPTQLNAAELGQTVQSISSPISTGQLQGRIPSRLKSITLGRTSSGDEKFGSQVTSRKFSPVRDWSTVDTIDVLAL